MAQQLTVQQRNAMFAQATRQNIQSFGKKTVNQGATMVDFLLPKARLLSKIYLECDFKFKLKHATKTSLETDEFTPYRPIRRISLDLNNGFSPYVIGGKELALLNAMRMNSKIVYPQHENETGYCYAPEALTASVEGTSNHIRTTIELNTTLNDRDPIGIVLLQNNETAVELKVDLESESMFVDNADGFVVEVEEITLQASAETFSIPAVAEAFPDISVIKLVTSRTETFAGNGQNLVDLTTGTIYRKLAFIVEDMNGKPFDDEDFSSNIDLIFNTADVNYSIPAKTLRHIDESQLGISLPKGCYAFDFSYNGLSNLGGTRDYIDTERLTSFQLRFNSAKAGRIRVINENLARLVG